MLIPLNVRCGSGVFGAVLFGKPQIHLKNRQEGRNDIFTTYRNFDVTSLPFTVTRSHRQYRLSKLFPHQKLILQMHLVNFSSGAVIMVRKTITVYLDEDAYKRLRELIKPKKISQELDMLIKRRIAELEGREYNPLEEADYEALKREHNRLVREAEKLRRHLKRRKVYSQLLQLAFNLGMKEDLSNLDEVVPKILDS